MRQNKKPPLSDRSVGKVDHISLQYAYVIVEGEKKDIFVPNIHLKGAMHGDTVEVIYSRRQNKKPEGKIVKILEHNHTHIVGQVEEQGANYFLLPDHKRLHSPILLSPEEGEKNVSQKAIVKITSWAEDKNPAEGTITKTLGIAGSHQAETEAISIQFGFNTSFPEDILKEANQFPSSLSEKEIQRRRDFRSITTLTIDPDDAQDFDDALSLEKLPNGHFQVGIHIADVSHYVKPQSPIDQEAVQRSTSVYLVGHTIPMLPERLSNDLCSLKPNQDRPAFSVVVELDVNAKIHHLWIGETIIHSDRRLTYAEAKEAIEEEKKPLHNVLTTLDQLAKKLREKRFEEGAIPFNTTDFNIHLDEAGEPINITPKQTSMAHKLIEEFMLLANRLVAEKVYHTPTPQKKTLPLIYRVHDRPDPEKVEQLAKFAQQLGYTFKPTDKNLSQAYYNFLTQIEGTPHQHTLQSLAIKTMAQARYSTIPNEHFGLAFKHYTHFTSPIRRYVDLLIHRLLKQYLKGESPKETLYGELAQYASQQERLAIDAERASINYKQVVFMKKQENKTFEGLISHMTQWGLYVELESNKCEGMVRLSDLRDDFYVFDPSKLSIRGQRKGKSYQLGEKVTVKVKKCDLEKRVIDLTLIG